MPDFRPPLSPEDLNKRRSAKTTRVDLEPYMTYILSIPEGGAGDIKLSESERKPTIKRRISMAATKVGKAAKYLRSSEDELLFLISQI